ncbi:hypothetical protein [Burkholderia anthina]|uniref:hypothetical protein n=1 Tax=Burkholderia anthina TaxID=179879 RepID=UPI0037C03091
MQGNLALSSVIAPAQAGHRHRDAADRRDGCACAAVGLTSPQGAAPRTAGAGMRVCFFRLNPVMRRPDPVAPEAPAARRVAVLDAGFFPVLGGIHP